MQEEAGQTRGFGERNAAKNEQVLTDGAGTQTGQNYNQSCNKKTRIARYLGESAGWGGAASYCGVNASNQSRERTFRGAAMNNGALCPAKCLQHHPAAAALQPPVSASLGTRGVFPVGPLEHLGDHELGDGSQGVQQLALQPGLHDQ